MMRKKIPFLAAAAVMTFGLTACSQDVAQAKNYQVKRTQPVAAQSSQNDLADYTVTQTTPLEAASDQTASTTTQINQASLQNAQTANGSVTVDNTVSYIGEDKAMTIALEHSNYTQQDLVFSYVKLDFDDGVWNYDVEFYADNREYDYEIDAITGAILSFDFDMEVNFNLGNAANNQAANSGSGNSNTNTSNSNQANNTPAPSTNNNTGGNNAAAQTTTPAQAAAPAQTTTPTQTAAPTQTTAPAQPAAPAPSSGVSIDTARQTALARVPGATSSHIRIYQDYDDGRAVYEGKIIYNAMEYEFEIDAATGNITEWDAESIYD